MPCTCEYGWIICRYVSSLVIKKTFERKIGQNNGISAFNVIKNILLLLRPTDQLVVEDQFANHRITNEIGVMCIKQNAKRLEINPGAFRSSRHFTRIIRIFDCDITALDFSFLEDFRNLEIIILDRANNVHMSHWSTIPAHLTSLHDLEVVSIGTGLNEWTRFPILVNGLLTLVLCNNSIQDPAMDRILQWIAESPSKNTIENLDISYNQLTRIPRQISFFTQLKNIDIQCNPKLTTLHLESFNFASSSLNFLNLEYSNVGNIGTGAFQG